MRLNMVITDSGMGGLSLCALMAQQFRHTAFAQNFRLIYVNAAPSDEGYNSLSSRKEKIQTFESFLYGIQRWYNPQAVFVACHTLSVLLPEIPFVQKEKFPIEGIVEPSLELLEKQLNETPNSVVMLFATPTTIEEQTYTQWLQQKGFSEERLLAQACPNLATAISNDSDGSTVFPLIQSFVEQACQSITSKEQPIFAFLGCTHYGYRQAEFAKAFEALGYSNVQILNPNTHLSPSAAPVTPDSAADDMESPLEIEIVSSYALPENEVRTISDIIAHTSLKTANAIRNYTLKADLLDE